MSEALRDFNDNEKIAAIPNKEELDKISETESNDLSSVTGSTVSFIHSYSSLQNKPSLCQKCGEKNSFLDGAYLRSQYGELTSQYICKKCGFYYDTGDFFD